METWTPGPQRPLQTSLCSAVGWLPRGSSNSAGPRRDPQTSLTAIPASGDGKRKPETGAEGAAGGAKKKQKRVGPKGAASAYFYFTVDVRVTHLPLPRPEYNKRVNPYLQPLASMVS